MDPDLEKLLLVFLRVSVIVALLPVLGGRMIPPHFKAGLSLALAGFLAPLVPVSLEGPFVLRALRELLFGGAIGFSVTLVFATLIMAAQWASFMMGLTMASAFDPTIGGIASPVAQFMNIVAIVSFFVFDLHHQLILGLVETFRALPPADTLAAAVMELVRMLFVTAFKLAAPLLLVQVMSQLIMGFLAKAMPQANLLAVGLPVSLGLGFVALLLFLPFLLQVFVHLNFFPAWR